MNRRRPGAFAVVALIVVIVVGVCTACGDDDADVGTPRGRGGDTAPAAAGAQAYVGLAKRAAIAKAEAAGAPWRITREDDEHFVVTQDYVPERLNFEIDDGTVTEATYG